MLHILMKIELRWWHEILWYGVGISYLPLPLLRIVRPHQCLSYEIVGIE
jgi:hypothetical protein